MTEGTPLDVAEARAARKRAAIAEARPLISGQSDAAAVALLTDAYRRHDVFATPGQIALVAWHLAHPWQARLRPLHSWRQAQRLLRTPDPDIERLASELTAIRTLMRGVQQVRATSTKRTIDGPEHTVYVDPWSPELAAELRELAAPIHIAVVPTRK